MKPKFSSETVYFPAHPLRMLGLQCDITIMFPVAVHEGVNIVLHPLLNVRFVHGVLSVSICFVERVKLFINEFKNSSLFLQEFFMAALGLVAGAAALGGCLGRLSSTCSLPTLGRPAYR